MDLYRRLYLLLPALLLLSLTIAACSVPAPACDQASIIYPAGEGLQGGPLRLGVIDASHLFLSELPNGLKASQAQIAVLDDVRWGYIEPNAPQGDAHRYAWDAPSVQLDSRVAAYQDAGFELVIVLRVWNPWARATGPQGGLAAAAASTPPQLAYLDDYSAWVQALVERYDGDGVDDFPGLRDVDGDGRPDPVRFFQIETEAVTGVWWQGTSPETAASDYVTLLRAAARAARAASPDATIILGGIAATDMLDRYPSAADLQDVVTSISPDVCGALTAFQQILAAGDAYDIVAVHSIADYTGLAILADWVATLAGREKPVWITGAASAPALTADPQHISVNPLYPSEGEGLWNALRDPDDPNHAGVTQWYRAEQARLAFKKWVMAAWSGFDALVMGYEQDRPTYERPEYGLRDLAFQGMLAPGEAPLTRPVIHALATAQGQLGGYASVQRLLGFGPGVYAFEFMVEGQPVYAFWYDDGAAQGPDDPPASILLSLSTQEPQLLVFTIPTRAGQTSPDVAAYAPHHGVVTLTLTETPIIVRGRIEASALGQTFIPLALFQH
ncbi:MAG TPA: hypothetical protein G4O05_02480 [Caldilineae bacterium]|nr:hypothetical protein [Caldilineae bacterium]